MIDQSEVSTVRLSTNESSPVSWLEGEDLRPAGDHVGLGAAAHLDGDVLVVAGEEHLDRDSCNIY